VEEFPLRRKQLNWFQTMIRHMRTLEQKAKTTVLHWSILNYENISTSKETIELVSEDDSTIENTRAETKNYRTSLEY
jgi:hypothetical protein